MNASISLRCPAALAGLLFAAAVSAAAPGAPAFESPNRTSAVPIPAGQVERAVAELDGLALRLLARERIPGLAVAVVHGGKTVFAKGYGVRAAGSADAVDADTVFQLASVSKPLGATVVARQVGAGRIRWDTPVREHLPWFTLAEPWVGAHATIGDLYAHRSGLPDHAGDVLEDLGYDRREVLQRLRLLPLASFRDSYAYTNFGLTAAAEAVAVASGKDWAALSQAAIYEPLGMRSTSSRYADFMARPNRAVGHVRRGGSFVRGTQPRDPDAQSPAGGASSSASDMARWLAFVLAEGKAPDGRQLVPAAALLPALSPQSRSSAPPTADTRAGFYGFGFNVGTSPSGRIVLNHSGGFLLGAATTIALVPSADVGIVVLTNTEPFGAPETLAAEFTDLVQFGRIQRDWAPLFAALFRPMSKPEGSLVGVARPARPAAARPLATYAGRYRNDLYGNLDVVASDNRLELHLGPRPVVHVLRHWDGDVFTFDLDGENAPPGTISRASFTDDAVVLEYYDEEGLGTFVR
ncbi:MAG: serine hydrolase [Xanthomonadales bacterium]|nr:serine hydrolase [Xanthomonadales bacterium]